MCSEAAGTNLLNRVQRLEVGPSFNDIIIWTSNNDTSQGKWIQKFKLGQCVDRSYSNRRR